MSTKPLHNFHIPLPEDLYSSLRAEARRAKRPATQLAREAIAAWIDELRREALHREIAAYALANAGTCSDLDPDLEAAGVELLVDEANP